MLYGDKVIFENREELLGELVTDCLDRANEARGYENFKREAYYLERAKLIRKHSDTIHFARVADDDIFAYVKEPIYYIFYLFPDFEYDTSFEIRTMSKEEVIATFYSKEV